MSDYVRVRVHVVFADLTETVKDSIFYRYTGPLKTVQI